MWSRFIKSPVLPGLITALIIFRLLTRGLSWIGVVALVIVVLWLGISLVHWLVTRRERSAAPASDTGSDSSEPEEEPLISLVYLLEEPREATEETVRRCVSSALKLDLKSNDPQATEFVISADGPGLGPNGGTRHFIVNIPQGVFGVIVSPDPYIDNPRRYASETIRDKRLRTAVESHQAWISVDRMGDPPVGQVKAEAYAVIGKILASMAGPDCLALYCPELQRCNEFDLALIGELSGGEPLSVFSEPTFEPVIEIAEDNPRMVEAVEEAIRRWPEFVEAFHAREDSEDERFIIKAEFSEGKRSEFMWVSVTRIDGDGVTGMLMNDPHELVDVHRGQPVEVQADQLNDWLYPLPDGDVAGGFTLKVLADEEAGSDD